jgi:hypothetical protein
LDSTYEKTFAIKAFSHLLSELLLKAKLLESQQLKSKHYKKEEKKKKKTTITKRQKATIKIQKIIYLSKNDGRIVW